MYGVRVCDPCAYGLDDGVTSRGISSFGQIYSSDNR